MHSGASRGRSVDMRVPLNGGSYGPIYLYFDLLYNRQVYCTVQPIRRTIFSCRINHRQVVIFRIVAFASREDPAVCCTIWFYFLN